MCKKKCDCTNPPSVTITFGSRIKTEKVCDTIVPLGIKLPDGDDIIDHIYTKGNEPHIPRTTPPPLMNYEDDPALERLKFKISVNYCTIEHFALVVKAQSIDIIKPVTRIKDLSGAEVSTLPCGDYFWEWDGYGDLSAFVGEESDSAYHDEYGKDVLNTSFLKTHSLHIVFTYFWKTDGKEQQDSITKELVYKPISAKNDWLDVAVTDRVNRKLRLTMRPTLPDQVDPNNFRNYAQLKAMAQEGCEYIWRRAGNGRNTLVKPTSHLDPMPSYWRKPYALPHLPDIKLHAKGEDWSQTCRAVIASEYMPRHSDDMLPLRYSDSRSYSAGPGKHIAYNSKGIDQWEDLWFIETATHELGHNILDDAYGLCYSWWHKSTSTLLQNVDEEKAALRDVPAPFASSSEQLELDLMKYWIGTPVIDLNGKVVGKTYEMHTFGYVCASLDDVRGSVYLCRAKFTLKAVG